jgi:hypothetical protein
MGLNRTKGLSFHGRLAAFAEYSAFLRLLSVAGIDCKNELQAGCLS